MKREVIKKFKKEFIHAVDGGVLAIFDKSQFRWSSGFRFDDIDWNKISELNDNYVIVICDEFVEYRKALVEGKQIIKTSKISGLKTYLDEDYNYTFDNDYDYDYEIVEKEINLQGGKWFISDDGSYSPGISSSKSAYFGMEAKSEDVIQKMQKDMLIANRLRARVFEIEPDFDKDKVLEAFCIQTDFNGVYNTKRSIYCGMELIGAVCMSEKTAIQICTELNSKKFNLS